MTSETPKENSSETFTFQLNQFELSYLRNVVRNNIEETELHASGMFHQTAKTIYAKLCQAYVDEMTKRIPSRY